MKDGLEWVLKKRQNEEKMSRKKSWIERGKSGHGPGLLELPCVYLKKVDTSDGNQFARKLKKKSDVRVQVIQRNVTFMSWKLTIVALLIGNF